MTSSPANDPWLTRWLTEFTAQTAQPAILELGCGPAWDTRTLVEAGFTDVTALDVQERSRQPVEALGAKFIRHDLREPFLLTDKGFDVVVASLCLHYFSWVQTQAALSEVRRVLKAGGLFLCRVNSVQDVNYGAVGFPEIEPHFYQYGERTKRFFDQADLERFFTADWDIMSKREVTIHRFEKPKVVWEIAARAQ